MSEASEKGPNEYTRQLAQQIARRTVGRAWGVAIAPDGGIIYGGYVASKQKTDTNGNVNGSRETLVTESGSQKTETPEVAEIVNKLATNGAGEHIHGRHAQVIGGNGVTPASLAHIPEGAEMDMVTAPLSDDQTSPSV